MPQEIHKIDQRDNGDVWFKNKVRVPSQKKVKHKPIWSHTNIIHVGPRFGEAYICDFVDHNGNLRSPRSLRPVTILERLFTMIEHVNLHEALKLTQANEHGEPWWLEWHICYKMLDPSMSFLLYLCDYCQDSHNCSGGGQLTSETDPN